MYAWSVAGIYCQASMLMAVIYFLEIINTCHREIAKHKLKPARAESRRTRLLNINGWNLLKRR